MAVLRRHGSLDLKANGLRQFVFVADGRGRIG